MKLVLCLHCHDVFKLARQDRRCDCGEAHGRYVDDVNAVYGGASAVPLGFDNDALTEAVDRQPEQGEGREFAAFVIPKDCPTMKRL